MSGLLPAGKPAVSTAARNRTRLPLTFSGIIAAAIGIALAVPVELWESQNSGAVTGVFAGQALGIALFSFWLLSRKPKA